MQVEIDEETAKLIMICLGVTEHENQIDADNETVMKLVSSLYSAYPDVVKQYTWRNEWRHISGIDRN